ncbi:hypothetical protein SELMODRAFT_406351 [Selaginella moellendorffii]|uniref:Stress-response A/B barrel domain-containing protein n=1 Tax=Selaginella moellendorffii TaxID=88036 RepID=D8R235_SELML|nr:hypothetical protein SELMODRAFT_406351 [Selaginella moellendorffii]
MPIVHLVEHVLLFKVRHWASAEKRAEMVKQLNKLRAINGVLHLKAGPVLSIWPAHEILSGGYTHVLHSRHQNKAALAAFSLHPAQIYCMDKFVNPICESALALDWESSVEKHVDQFFEAKRIVLCRLKDGVCGDGREQLVSEIAEASRTSSFDGGGPNFSPVRARGFDFGYLAFFRWIDEVELIDNSPEVVLAKLKEGPFVEDFILVDYWNETGMQAENSPLAEPGHEYV